MKKRFMFIFILFLFLICTIFLICFISKNTSFGKQDKNETNSTVDELSVAMQLFSATDIEELKNVGKSTDTTIEIYDEYKQAVAIGVEYLSVEDCTMIFNFNDNGKFEKCYIGFAMSDVSEYLEESVSDAAPYESNTDKVDLKSTLSATEDCRLRCESIVSRLCREYRVEKPNNICVFTFDGDVYRFEDEKSIDALVTGDGVLKFSIRDQEGYFWELQINGSGGTLTGEITKYFDCEQTSAYYVNISLSGYIGEPVEITEVFMNEAVNASEVSFSEAEDFREETSQSDYIRQGVIAEITETVSEEITEAEDETV